MGLADLHIHTNFSWDSTTTVPAILKYVADYTDLDVIAITDHDEIRGALQALDRASAYGVQVIPGSEITTQEGHLIALFIQEKIPAGLSLIETIKRVGRLGGLCIAAHPMALWAGALNARSIRRAVQYPYLSNILVGIETFNAGLIYQRTNRAAQALARTLPLSLVGSSDSHMLKTIGLGVTYFRGSTPADLRADLLAHATLALQRAPANGVRILGDWLPRIALRKAGWIVWNESPSAPLRYSRTSQI